MRDSFGRTIDYLRLSVTDRCNLRCRYCLPADFNAFSPRNRILSDDETVRLVEGFAAVGFTTVRVTGGEPLVRPGIEALIGRLAAIDGIDEVALSTNGILLAKKAKTLKSAGLSRVNVSLDSLRPERFAAVTRSGKLSDAWAGIEAALDADLGPVKINVVVARGLNDDEVEEFAALTVARPLHVRFIELMPMGETGFFSKERWVPMPEIERRAGPLEPVTGSARPAGRGPARVSRRPGARGTLGFISALSCSFCSDCNRVRLSATGKLVACLDGEDGTDLRAMADAEAGTLEDAIRAAVGRKPESHRMLERVSQGASPRMMCQIGG
ncbi:MAG: GTP 3',8-cyclase MoaA [Elusimicrobia bacterium CG_4_9_14_3_um_filter_62_55]|nr:MAG: GTP 3',8-cyclase MoaA [Elusimicrobia bacterium CG22_combo_CG10-13_8_21_14_all_63_91]PJA11669.1 MAG: GTP 3',8-cyclase MoaA [Elusimicrobia bacterium CG_4_10_14_0_2_um_filter_63_34]PJB23082.1 MAG: GTP 3',8-cyclase MoaA [Elusimicrobia bacterium CG_4_9_14_3_um_filter_62_55]